MSTNTQSGYFKENLISGYCFASTWDVVLSATAESWDEFWTGGGIRDVSLQVRAVNPSSSPIQILWWIRPHSGTLFFCLKCYELTRLQRHSSDIFHCHIPFHPLFSYLACLDSALKVGISPYASSPLNVQQRVGHEDVVIDGWLMDPVHSSALLSTSSKLPFIGCLMCVGIGLYAL